MNILKRGLSLVKSAFWRESRVSWGRLSGIFASALAAAIGFTFLPLSEYWINVNSSLGLSAFCAFAVSLLIWLGKMISGSKFVQASLARGGGPLFFLFFLNLAFGIYLAATAPIIEKHGRQLRFYNEKLNAANETFNRMGAARGMNILMVGTLVKKADRADPIRLKRAENEKRIFGGAPEGQIEWVKWLNDYPDLAKAQLEVDEARLMSERAGSTFNDIIFLRDPVKWGAGFCLCWLCFQLILFCKKITPLETKAAWLFRFKVFAAYSVLALLRLLNFSLILLGALSLSTFSPLNSSVITLSAALIAAIGISFYVLPWAAPGNKTLKTLLSRLAAVTAASLLLILFTHAIWHGKAAALKQSIKEKGWPSSLADFQTNVPDEQYAGSGIESALKRLGIGAMDEKTDIALKTLKWDKEIFERQSAFVARQLPLIAKQFSPAIKGRTRWMKADYLAAVKNPFGLPVPKFFDQIKLSKLLRLCASVEAVRGNLPEAWGYVRLQLRIADIVSTDPSLIAKMITVVLRRQAALAAVGIMLNRPLTAIPTDIAESLQAFPSGSLVSDGMKMEAAKFCDFIASPLPVEDRKKISKAKYYKGEVQSHIWAITGLADLSIAKSASYYSQLVITPSRYKLFEPRGTKADMELQNLPDWPYFLTKTMTGKFSDLHEKEWEMKAWAQISLVASAAGKYYGAHKRYPVKIRELSPAYIPESLLADPFSDRDFEYAAVSGGFSLCSLGPKGNRKDNKELTFCIQQAR